ncbi:hypothetical protein LTR36_009402 [Oleoguttula mirabilis]|uniref:Heterokaryon incompatibility domain-containing protein n=1 Tax=Oleoguttula mirabilis TaxID=1507867 RepID=A0AAV9JSL1_9PEZI|nr:hypothetical protein LTR36_009402 [Oleoguttula mirabilis]
MATYRYSPLDSSKKEIRLLHLQPGVFGEELIGSLHTVTLCSSPDYEAISYAWGSLADKGTVTVTEGGKLEVTRNLFQALRRLRNRRKSRTLWVDAICINQGDLDERSAQVAFMGDIYATARQCAIWLGELDESGDLHPSFHQRLMDSWALMSRQDTDWYTWVEEPGGYTDLRDLIYCQIATMDAVLRTASPSWHSRAWVRQEFCRSKSYRLYFGPVRLFRRRLAIMLHTRSIWDTPLKALLTAIWEMSDMRNNLLRPTDKSTLADILKIRHICEATEPRDIIYSVLSLITPQEQEIIGSRYDIPEAQVFAKATFAVLKAKDRTHVLSFVKPTNGGVDADLPTWTINFSDPNTSLLVPRESHEDEGYSLSISISEDCKQLTMRGVSLDLTRTVCPLPLAEASEEKGDRLLIANARKDVALDSMPTLTGCKEVDVDHEDLLHTAHTTLIAGRCSADAITSIFEQWDVRADSHRPHRVEDDDVPINMPMMTLLQYAEHLNGTPALFMTSSGYMGVAPDTIRPGDSLVIPLFTASDDDSDATVPPSWFEQAALILRPQGDKWTFHGLAYVHRYGSLLSEESERRDFVIC